MKLGHPCYGPDRPTSFTNHWSDSGSVQHIERPLDGCLMSPAAQRLARLTSISAQLSSVVQPGCFPMNPSANFGEPRSLTPSEPDSSVGATHLWRAEFYPGPGRQPQRVKKAAPTRGPVAKTAKAVSAAKPQSGAKVRLLAQSNPWSCGQTSVAIAVNAVSGKTLTDREIGRRYGFSLIQALNTESKGSGYQWCDGGNFQAKHWRLLETKLNFERTPVIIGLNGPEFSPSGRGHIITLLSIEGNKVRYADPADGTIKITTREAIERAPSHQDGKFFFYANKI